MVDLIQRVLNHEASLEDIDGLNKALPEDPALLRYFVEMRMLHGALEEQFGHQSSELASISDRFIGFPRPGHANVSGPSAMPAAMPRWQKFAMVAAVAMVAALGASWGVSKLLYRPAFEVVARYNTGNQDIPERGQWLKTRQTIELHSGAVELRSADGNSFTFQGPGELKIHGTQELTLFSGKLWADLPGDPVKIHAPRGEVTDLGTTFGLDASTRDATRIDVFDGKIRFRNTGNPSQASDAEKGESLTSKGADWTPQRGEADASRYKVGIRRPLGFTFVADDAEAESIASGLPFGIRWTTADTASGSMRIQDTPVEIAWAGSSLFSAGTKGSPEAEELHTHMLGFPWSEQYEGRAAEADALGLSHTKGGIAIQLRNLDAWRESIGAKAFRVMIHRNSGYEEVRFYPIYAYSADSGALLSTLEDRQSDYLPGGYPDEEEATGARVIKRFDQAFTEDSLNLVVEPQLAPDMRSNISGLILEPVF